MPEWRDIPGFEGLYQASRNGKIRRLTAKVFHPRQNTEITRNGHVMKSYTTSDGYQALMLCKDGKKKRARVHRLVAMAFIPNPEAKPCINHKNGDKSDNRVDNLEWCTYRENSRHAVDVLHRTINKRTVAVVRSDGEFFPDMKSAARALDMKNGGDIHRAMKSKRKNGKSRTVKGFTFRPATREEIEDHMI